MTFTGILNSQRYKQAFELVEQNKHRCNSEIIPFGKLAELDLCVSEVKSVEYLEYLYHVYYVQFRAYFHD